MPYFPFNVPYPPLSYSSRPLITTQGNGFMEPVGEPKPFLADEEANWEAYGDSLAEVKEEEKAFDEEYQRYLDEMAEAMMTDKHLREEIIQELSRIGSEQELSQEDSELLKLAQRLYEEDLRTEGEEQERQLGMYRLNQE